MQEWGRRAITSVARAIGLNRQELEQADVQELLRHRTAERADQALNATGSNELTVNPNAATFRSKLTVQQKSRHVLQIGNQDFTHRFLQQIDNSHNVAQSDINANFVPFGWSCTLGTHKDIIYITAYEGRNSGEASGSQILVVKNTNDEILRIIPV